MAVLEDGTAPAADPGAAAGAPAKPEPATGAAAQAPLTADVIAEAMKRAGVGAQPAAAAAPRQYTQEEFDKAFKVFRPTKEHLGALRAAFTAAADDPENGAKEEKALAMLTEMLHGAARQAVTMSAYHSADIEERIQGAVAPALQFIQAQQEQKLEVEFYEQHKELEQYKPIVKMVVDQMKQKGFPQGTTKETVFKQVAELATATIKALPQGEGFQPVAPAAANGSPTHKMTTLTGGGIGGGAGRGGKPAATKSPGMAVWD